MSLEQLGWNEYWEDLFQPHREEGLLPGRVAAEFTHLYRVVLDSGELLAEVPGSFRHRAGEKRAYPAVGDWVAVEIGADPERGQIQVVLPRKSKFARKQPGTAIDEQVVAANVDSALLMSGLDQDLNPRRIERYLMAAREGGVEPVIVLNKSDLWREMRELEPCLREIEAVAPGIPLQILSALEGEGVEGLAPYLQPGRTLVLLGSSGVGKSTLTNRLLGRAVQPTAEVREKDSRGRHTTTHRELFVLPEGGLLIDTPGLREIHLWEDTGSLEALYSDVLSLADQCRFDDCRHLAEPGCAIREAVERGELSPLRYQSYLKLHGELQEVGEKQQQLNWQRKRRGRPQEPRRFHRGRPR
ncbi:MAG: ribosome small subunit-dependent GTPase A [Armatimonadetes bacterium]|nr:ribosome small subunit-dependent GTPase A [Armatimonadota bacterium]